MAGFGNSRCECCEREFMFSALVSKKDAPKRCGMCEMRGGLCLHNLPKRFVQGEPLRFHSSRPHDGMEEFKDRPEDCPVCLEARENAAWGREAMKLNPVGVWPVASRESKGIPGVEV